MLILYGLEGRELIRVFIARKLHSVGSCANVNRNA